MIKILKTTVIVFYICRSTCSYVAFKKKNVIDVQNQKEIERLQNEIKIVAQQINEQVKLVRIALDTLNRETNVSVRRFNEFENSAIQNKIDNLERGYQNELAKHIELDQNQRNLKNELTRLQNA
ncbi:hypothetical protein COBT_002734 [Conglomerata obtusa]